MIKRGIYLLALVFLISFVSATESYTVTDYTSTLAIVSISNADDAYGYEATFEYTGDAGSYDIDYGGFLGEGTQTGSNLRGGNLSVYESKLDNTKQGVSGNGQVFNISHSGTLTLKSSLTVLNNTDESYVSYSTSGTTTITV